jgi:lysophospholipase L1-like esterase
MALGIGSVVIGNVGAGLGQPNGAASLDGSGKVPAAQLPSYVDDVLEFANFAAFPATGETGKIYVAIDSAKSYRWSGSAYIEVSPSPDLSNYVLKAGDTMTGKLNLPATTTTQCGLNLGIGTQPTAPVNGDIWIDSGGLKYKESFSLPRTCAAREKPNTFTAEQAIQMNSVSNPALSITQNGNGGGLVIINPTGTGESLRIEDESPETTPFVVSATGKVGIGTAPDTTVGLKLDSTGVKFSDGTIQTTAASVTYGTTAGTACEGNDSRLSDARTPTAHKLTHATGGTDALTPFDIGAELAFDTILDTNTSVVADAAAPVRDANFRPGWYFSNNVVNSKFNWYFYSKNIKNLNLTLGNSNLYCIATIDQLANQFPQFPNAEIPDGPNLYIYTTPQVGDPNFYRSRVVYTLVEGSGQQTGIKYLMHTGADPGVFPELPRLQLVKSTIQSVGPQNPNEEVLYYSVQSNSNAPVNTVKLLIESNGFVAEENGFFKYDFTPALLNHTHPLSQLTQSSAMAGQVPVWNGTAWVPQNQTIRNLGNQKIGFAGDSLALGYGTTDMSLSPFAWFCYYLNTKSRMMNWNPRLAYVNSAPFTTLDPNGGYVFARGSESSLNLPRQLALIQQRTPDVLILQIGTVDDMSTLANINAVFTRVTEFLTAVKSAGVKHTVVFPVPPKGSNATAPASTIRLVNEYNKILENYCKENFQDLTFFDTYEGIVNPTNTSYVPVGVFDGSTKQSVTYDGLHFSTQGVFQFQDVFANTLFKDLPTIKPKATNPADSWDATNNIRGNLLGTNGLMLSDTGGVATGWTLTNVNGSGMVATPSRVASELYSGYTMQKIAIVGTPSANNERVQFLYNIVNANFFNKGLTNWYFELVYRIKNWDNLYLPNVVVQIPGTGAQGFNLEGGGSLGTLSRMSPISNGYFQVTSTYLLKSVPATNGFSIFFNIIGRQGLAVNAEAEIGFVGLWGIS